MTIEKHLQKVLDTFISFFGLESISGDIYIAGGAIRDMLNKKDPKDYDIYFTNPTSAEFAKKLVTKKYFLNNNENLDSWVGGFRINAIFNEEFCVPPKLLIKEFNFHQNMNYYHNGLLFKDGSVSVTFLRINFESKYPLGTLMKIPRMVSLGYKIEECDYSRLLGQVLKLGIKSQEQFHNACPNISAGVVGYCTGLPTERELFDASEIGQALS